tara:strand:+ start:1286 stop:1546 length:261 start_codon:yes stop_codon:yes gene_type:complete
MLGFSALAETTFGATAFDDITIVVIVSGSGVTVSQNANGITFTMTGSVSPTGSGLTVSTGAEDVNVLTWNAIDPGVTMTWTNIDPL